MSDGLFPSGFEAPVFFIVEKIRLEELSVVKNLPVSIFEQRLSKGLLGGREQRGVGCGRKVLHQQSVDWDGGGFSARTEAEKRDAKDF